MRSCNVTRSQVEIWSLVPFDIRRAGQKVSCQCTLSLVHNCNTASRLRKTACPTDALFAAMDAAMAGLRGAKWATHFFEIRGVMVCCKRRGSFQRMHEPPPLDHVS